MRDGIISERRRVIFAIPAYDSKVHLETVGALIVAGRELEKGGVEWGLIYQGGSSIISKARNSLVHVFMSMPEATDLFFIDSDITCDAEEILKLVAWGDFKDFVCGAYRLKRDDIKYTVHPVMNGEQVTFDEETKRLIKISGIGTGFMLINRRVFETMREKLDIKKYNDITYGRVENFFHFDYDEENEEYVGEDIYFCHKAIEAGVDIWCDPSIVLNHIGDKAYTGKLADEFRVIKLQPEKEAV